MRLYLLTILTWAPLFAAAATGVIPTNEPPSRCESLVSPGEANQRILAALFDHTGLKTMSVVPGVNREALDEFFMINDHVEAHGLRLATRWMHGQLFPEAELYVEGLRGKYKRTLETYKLEKRPIHKWVSNPGAEEFDLGWLMVDGDYDKKLRPYLNVQLVDGHEAVFTLGLDVDCVYRKWFSDGHEEILRVQTESGFLCRIPMLRGKAQLKGWPRPRRD